MKIGFIGCGNMATAMLKGNSEKWRSGSDRYDRFCKIR